MVSPGLGLYVKNGGGGDRTRDVCLHEPCDEAKTLVFVRAGGNEAEGKLRAELERALVERDGSRDCFYCGYNGFFGGRPIDHVTAKKRGGSDAIDNLVFACRDCNFLKGNVPGWFFVFWRWNWSTT